MTFRNVLLTGLTLAVLVASVWECRVVAHDILLKKKTLYWQDMAGRFIDFDAQYFSQLAESRPETRAENIGKSIYLNPWNTNDTLVLSEEYETHGQLIEAEKLLIQAETHDAGPLPKWALANFYLRNDQNDKFFAWGNRYRATSSQPGKAYLRLALETDSDVNAVVQKMIPLSCGESAALLELLDLRDESSDLVLDQLAHCTDAESRSAFARHVSQLLIRDRPSVARAQWSRFGQRDSLFNGDFATTISEQGFDWRINRVPGITFTQHDDEPRVRLNVDSKATKSGVFMFQPIILDVGRYRLTVTSECGNPVCNSIFPEIVELSTGRVVASGHDAADRLNDPLGTWSFDAPSSKSTLVLALVYSPDTAAFFSGKGEVALAVKSVKLEKVYP
jgi:hypothetical protein